MDTSRQGSFRESQTLKSNQSLRGCLDGVTGERKFKNMIKINAKHVLLLLWLAFLWIMIWVPGHVAAAEPIKIGLIQGLDGPLDLYARQEIAGFKMGLEYATQGTNKIAGRNVNLIIERTQSKPEEGVALLTKLYKKDRVDLAVGPTSSAVALACLPVAKKHKKILIVEPAVADSITGDHWNRYIFRTGRNSSQDAISNAAAVAKPGVSIATIAQDYAFGRDGIAAYKRAAEKLGAKIVDEEFIGGFWETGFTPPIQRMINALKKKPGLKYIYVIWAGMAGPWPELLASGLDRHGIQIATGGNILPVLKGWKRLKGMVGATYYYYECPQNPVNDWLVKVHMERFKEPPDFFTCGGFASAMAVVEGLRKAENTETERLIEAMEGMEFMTPKGKMIFRKEDHQALQTMYSFRLEVRPDVAWAVPVLVRELSPEETAPPIMVKR
jgi:branched-chain amino acid transport system substrate-binding protein